MTSQQNHEKSAPSDPHARSDMSENLAAQKGRHGYLGDEVPGLVPPSKLNPGDTGTVSDTPDAGGELNFDDDAMDERENTARSGGTWAAHGADSAPLGPPAEILSSSNLPSDPPAKA
ncbi:MAG: serine/threonine protein kinase [Polaromonas sp.]